MERDPALLPFVLGLTGGIACGKSQVATFLLQLGVPVLDSDAVVHELYAGGAAVAPVNRGADIQRDPQFVARGAMVEVAGRVLPASPIRLSTPGGETSDTNRTPPGVVGADTDAVLQGAGFAADEIAAMRDSGLV